MRHALTDSLKAALNDPTFWSPAFVNARASEHDMIVLNVPTQDKWGDQLTSDCNTRGKALRGFLRRRKVV
jgi:hypothetical protein